MKNDFIINLQGSDNVTDTISEFNADFVARNLGDSDLKQYGLLIGKYMLEAKCDLATAFTFVTDNLFAAAKGKKDNRGNEWTRKDCKFKVNNGRGHAELSLFMLNPREGVPAVSMEVWEALPTKFAGKVASQIAKRDGEDGDNAEMVEYVERLNATQVTKAGVLKKGWKDRLGVAPKESTPPTPPTPPASGDDTPPASGDDTPPASGDDTPPASGDDTPPEPIAEVAPLAKIRGMIGTAILSAERDLNTAEKAELAQELRAFADRLEPKANKGKAA